MQLTGISEVEVVVQVREVLRLLVLHPVCIGLNVVSDEKPKQDDHSDLPDEADCRQTDAYVGVLLRAEKVSHDAALITPWPRTSAVTFYLWHHLL